jgi:hypothetical protein
LCNQKDVGFEWELLIAEEVHTEQFGHEGVQKFVRRLKKANCVNIQYIELKYHILLIDKWQILGEHAHESSCTSSIENVRFIRLVSSTQQGAIAWSVGCLRCVSRHPPRGMATSRSFCQTRSTRAKAMCGSVRMQDPALCAGLRGVATDPVGRSSPCRCVRNARTPALCEKGGRR